VIHLRDTGGTHDEAIGAGLAGEVGPELDGHVEVVDERAGLRRNDRDTSSALDQRRCFASSHRASADHEARQPLESEGDVKERRRCPELGRRAAITTGGTGCDCGGRSERRCHR
jgi:hypothetical protein